MEVFLKMSEREETGIVNSTLQLVVAVFFIKILGLAKKSIIAAVCGATAETDAFFIASEVIVALCTVFFSSISISLLSMHTQRLLGNGRKESNNLINVVLRIFIPISVLISFIFILFSKNISKLLAPTYEGVQLQNLSEYIKIMAIMFVFSCYYLIINVTLETDKKFLPGKGQAFFQNLFVILAAIFFYPRMGIASLLWAFVLAGFVQCVQITWNSRKIFRFQLKISSEKSSIKKLVSLAGPLLIGNAIYEINDIVDKQISSGLGHGGVSVLSYGASINEIVTSLIVTSLSTVLFSHYATWIAEGKKDRVGDNLKRSLEYLFVIIMPIMVMCFVAGDTIVGVLYGRGNFGAEAIERTNGVVIGYAAGFFFQAARATLVKAYYAFQDTKTPMINGVISVCLNVVLSIVLSHFIGESGIAFATSIAMLVVTVLLLPKLYKLLPSFSLKSSAGEYAKVTLATCIVWITALMLRHILTTGVYLSFFVMGIYIVCSYLLLLMVLRVACMKDLISKLKAMMI